MPPAAAGGTVCAPLRPAGIRIDIRRPTTSPTCAPASLPAELASQLDEFGRSETARACEHPAGAYANCLAVSGLCAQRLRDRGVPCGLLHLAGSREACAGGAGRWPFCDPADTQHWTVRVAGWSIDWTARQFRAEARWPEIETVDALPIRWRLVEDWACERCAQLVVDPRHLELTPAGLDREHRTVARASRGRGPFADPRHDGTPALVRLCACLTKAARAAA